jgi:hypothetical protein
LPYAPRQVDRMQNRMHAESNRYKILPTEPEMNFLNVPYAEKDEARALGARWNPGRKKWYVPAGVPLEPFEKWLDKDGAAGAGPSAAGASKAGGRVDSAAAKLVTGAHYIELDHACNPFEPCAACAQALAGSRWLEARQALAATIAQLAQARR